MASKEQRGWVCLVCGYVHRDSSPPENCPVCGAARSDFEPYEAPLAQSVKTPSRWRCLICSYEHQGAVPPNACPVCGAASADFESGAASESESGTCGGGRFVIAGGGIAGLSAAAALREASPDAVITLLSKEPEPVYYRLNLTRFLAGELDDAALSIHPLAWYEDRGIRFLSGAEVTAILPDERCVEIDKKAREPFDKLILTCGAHPFVPPIPGASREGVMALRTHAQAKTLLGAIRPGTPCVCIGGGILGLETAAALAKRGAAPTLLEGYEWLLPRQLNPRAGELLARAVAGLGIAVRLGVKVREIQGDERVRGVALDGGEAFPAEQVVITAGVRANSYLARQAGLEVNQGIVVDSHLTTSHPDILAAGDVAEHRGTVYGLWDPARHQGGIAGSNAAGLRHEFGGLPRINTLKVLGIDLFSAGVVMPSDASFQEFEAEQDGNYHRFLFRDNLLAGAILLGDVRCSAAAVRAIRNRSDFSWALRGSTALRDIQDWLDERRDPPASR